MARKKTKHRKAKSKRRHHAAPKKRRAKRRAKHHAPKKTRRKEHKKEVSARQLARMSELGLAKLG